MCWSQTDFPPNLQKQTKKIEEKRKQVGTRNSENNTFLQKKQANKNFSRTKLRQPIALA